MVMYRKIVAGMVMVMGASTLLNAGVYKLAVVNDSSSIPQSKTYAGSLYSPQETMVATRMMGYIKRLAVDEGDYVKKGSILFEVDPTDVEAGQNQAGSAVIMAKSAYEDAKRDYERFSLLYDKGAVPARDLEKMKLNMDVRHEQLSMAQAGLKQAKAQTSYTTVRSPVSGVVIRKMANVSEMALPGRPIVVLSSTDQLKFQATIPEGDAGRCKVGDTVALTIPSLGKNVSAKISAVIPAADMATHSYVVKATLLVSQGLMPGMYATMSINNPSASVMNSVTVPVSAMTKRGGLDGVFVDNGGHARFIATKIVRLANDFAIVQGLASGQKVVIYPKADLIDGANLK